MYSTVVVESVVRKSHGSKADGQMMVVGFSWKEWTADAASRLSVLVRDSSCAVIHRLSPLDRDYT